ncbi:MAG: transposase [Opitutales bacterium]|nr:transposase [Opitutales bacterium]MCH8539193.1 transposase [Opitutales bacterium]
MRQKRILFEDAPAVYHVMSRTVNGEKLLGEKEKAVMRKMLFKVAAFAGVKILTYCLMSNHFHVLIEVPDASGVKLSDEELLKRYEHLHGEDNHLRKSPRSQIYAPNTPDQIKRILQEGGEESEKLRQALHKRMHNLTSFVQTFKQRVSIWYNANHRRFGPLWSDRFKSLLVEGQGPALQIVAAYIDLNPVRAGLVEDPAKYPFSGYGEAAISREIETDLGYIVGAKPNDAPAEILREYRLLVLGLGAKPKESQSHLKNTREEMNKLLCQRETEDQNRTENLPEFAPLVKGQALGRKSFVEKCSHKLQAGNPLKKPHKIKPTSFKDIYTPNQFRSPSTE